MYERRKLRGIVEKSKVMMMGGERVQPQVEVLMNVETLEVVTSFKYLESCFNKDGALQEDVKMRVGEGLETFGVIKMFNIRSVSLGVKREYYERVVVSTVTYETESWGMHEVPERRKLDVMEMKCYGVSAECPGGISEE